MIVRPGVRDELVHLRFGHSTRVGEPAKIHAVLGEFSHVLVGRHPDHHQFAPLVGAADGLDLHATGGRRQRAIVLELVGVVREFLRRTDVVAEHVLGSRNARHQGQVIDQRTARTWIAEPGLVVLGECFVLALFRIAGVGGELLRGERGRGKRHEPEQEEAAVKWAGGGHATRHGRLSHRWMGKHMERAVGKVYGLADESRARLWQRRTGCPILE